MWGVGSKENKAGESLDGRWENNFKVEGNNSEFWEINADTKLSHLPDRKLGHNCSANALPPGALYSLTIGYSLTTNSYR